MVTTIKNIITSYFSDVWPIIIIITVIVSSLRIAYLIKNNQKFCFYKEVFMLLFILYVMCLFEVVTLQDHNYGLSNYIPFKEIFRYEMGSYLFVRNIIGNILLFLPYGYFAADYLKSKKVLPVCFLTFLVTITIELVQLNIGRTFDIDDVILNTLGGMLGYFLYRGIEKIKVKLPKFFKTDGFINFFVILILIISIVYLFDWPVIEWLNS
ncbi:MAG: VanZ family protein [Bacilli bacterium]|nr:VanZ family protein [Bacilli bacterium]